jgi:hypothetical protein
MQCLTHTYLVAPKDHGSKRQRTRPAATRVIFRHRKIGFGPRAGTLRASPPQSRPFSKPPEWLDPIARGGTLGACSA